MNAVPLIELREVVKSLGEKRVLDGICMTIKRGEITAVIGKSGSGKSVLLKNIIGLMDPEKGEILFDGRLRAAMSPAEKRSLRQKFSFVFQDAALFDFMSVFQNVALPLVERHALPPPEIQRRVRGKLEQLDLHQIEDSYPSQLSGGMKKRVALARALVTDPEIVLFDEPTTGLDPIRKNAVHSMILDYQSRFGFTAVVVSHEVPDIFFIAQHVALIDKGRIRFEGSPLSIQQSTDPEVINFIEGMESPRDALTGAMAPSFGNERMLQEIGRLQQHAIPFAVVVLTVTNIEELDRMAGHMVGHAVFSSFARHVARHTYVSDTCFRYAMNKMLVILPDTSGEQASSFCQKLARTLDQGELFSSCDPVTGFCFSVSAGIAPGLPDSSPEELIAAAERLQAVFYQCQN
jgi:phospholipid/cholesterol/gamma-HCH transport system ATP-binding protein